MLEKSTLFIKIKLDVELCTNHEWFNEENITKTTMLH